MWYSETTEDHKWRKGEKKNTKYSEENDKEEWVISTANVSTAAIKA